MTPSSASPGESRPTRVHRVTAFAPPDRPVEGNTINVREASPTPAALAGAEEHLRTLTDRYSAFEGSVLGQSASLVLAELVRLREQRDAVLALCDEADDFHARHTQTVGASALMRVSAVRRALGVSE